MSPSDWNGIRKEIVPLTVGDWMDMHALQQVHYCRLLLQSLLSLYTTIDLDPESLNSHLGILAEQAW